MKFKNPKGILISDEKLPLKRCPPGLFLYDDILCLKTRYGVESYILCSGEYFSVSSSWQDQYETEVYPCKIISENMVYSDFLLFEREKEIPLYSCGIGLFVYKNMIFLKTEYGLTDAYSCMDREKFSANTDIKLHLTPVIPILLYRQI